MAIEFKKTDVASGRFPEIWRGECKVLPGGYKPKQNFPNGTLLRRGALLSVDFDNRSAAVVKIATALSGSTTKAVRVAKGLPFGSGDVVAKFGGDGSTANIASIDTTNADYDVINLQTAITGLTSNDVLVESSSTTSEVDNATKAKYVPNAILAADVFFDGRGIPVLDAAYEAVVLKTNVAYPIPAQWLVGGACLATNHNILFITQ